MRKLLRIYFLVILCLLCVKQKASAQMIKFNHTYGNMPYNYGMRIIEADDRGYYILSNVSAYSGNNTIDIIRTDSLGNILSNKNIGDGSIYWANDFIRTTDHGFLICGLTNKFPEKGYDMLLIKTDANLNVEWEKNYGGSDWDIANAVKETKDSAYIIVGLTYSYGPANENIYILKTNYAGDTIWTKTFGGDSTDYANAVDVRYDSTYLIGATTNSFGHGNFDGYVLNLNTDGDTLWTKTYGEEKEDIIYAIRQTPDSGFVFVGSTMSYHAIQHENWLMKFDKNRDYEWKLPEFWDISPADDVLYNVGLTDSAHYLLTGYTTYGDGSKNLFLLVLRGNFNFKCSMVSSSLSDEVGYQIIQTADKGYAIVGYTEGFGAGLTNIFVIKVGNDCGSSTTYEQILDVEEHQAASENELFGIYPSISKGVYRINMKDDKGEESYKIYVFNIFGQEIYSGNWEVVSGSDYKIDISNAADGIYFVRLSGHKKISSFKVIKCGK